VNGQPCGWPGCPVTARRRFCAPHWARLPRQIRQDLTGVPPDGATPGEVLTWMRQVQDAADAAAERGRQADTAQGSLW
jgi:hypothetical protein